MKIRMLLSIFISVEKLMAIWVHGFPIIRVPKAPFRFFDKLKYQIRNKVLIFVSIMKLRYKT